MGRSRFPAHLSRVSFPPTKGTCAGRWPRHPPHRACDAARSGITNGGEEQGEEEGFLRRSGVSWLRCRASSSSLPDFLPLLVSRSIIRGGGAKETQKLFYT